MLPQTRDLRRRIKALRPREQLEVLSNAYTDTTAIVVGCGPTAVQILGPNVFPHLTQFVLIAIKQALELVGPTAPDFHFLNPVNLEQYEYSTERPITVGTVYPGDTYGWDVEFPLLKSTLDNQLVRTHAFDAWDFDASLERPWGPSLLLEYGFYFLKHIGVQRIVTFGWDLSKDNDNPHFYDERRASYAAAEGENQLIADAAAPFSDWLATHGISLCVGSTGSLVSPRVPRVTIGEELL